MPKIVDKDKKRDNLVKAAIPVFAKYGFRDTKMNDVAISADVGKGTLYEYFESKDELFLHIFKMWFSLFPDQMQEIMSHNKNPYEQLTTFFAQYFSTIKSYSETYYIYFDFWTELIRNKKLADIEIRETYEALRALFSEVVAEGISKGIFKDHDTVKTATALLALADGLLLQWLIDKDAFCIAEIGSEIVSNYLNSLKV